MTAIALASARGAPGVTTTALLLAAALPGSVLVEADVSGGVLAARYGLGREPGLTTLAAAARSGDALVWEEHAQFAGGVPTIVGPDSATAAQALWDRAGDRLAASLARLDPVVVADFGRLGPRVPLAGVLDVAILVLAPLAEHLVSASHRLAELGHAARNVGAVVVGDGPYSARQVAEQLGAELLGAIPADARAAAMLEGRNGGARSFARSRLARSGAALADSVAGVLAALHEPVVAQ